MVAVAPTGDGGGRLLGLGDDGAPAGEEWSVADLAAAVAAYEGTERPRWLWASTAAVYPRLLRAGLRVGRCHDIELTETLLLGYEGRYGEPRALPAIWARRHSRPVPPDPPAHDAPPRDQDALFDELPTPTAVEDPLAAVVGAYADQVRRIAATEH